MAFRYVWEKTFEAVSTLATVDVPLPERLEYAYTSGLLRLDGEPDWGTDEILSKWQEIVGAVRDVNGEPRPLTDTIAEMDDVERVELATSIVSLYAAVEREHGRRDPDF